MPVPNDQAREIIPFTLQPVSPKRAQTRQQRQEVLRRLGEAWEKTPSLRLGQLIGNANGDPYYVEDFDLVEEVESYAYPRREIGR